MKYNGSNLKEVLDAHKRWLERSDGWTVDDWANLSIADLKRADLRGANLSEASLRTADLRGANLSEANLSYADLEGVNLLNANLRGANLSEASLVEADLRGANLSEADLNEADLTGANLRYADLIKARNVPFIPMSCPDTGSFTAWKKCICKNDSVIVKLLIPEDAKRSSSTNRKCRADKAVVLEIQNMGGKPLDGVKAWSIHDDRFAYVVGETVVPKEPFCEDRFNECASGIHFFVNRQEAVDY